MPSYDTTRFSPPAPVGLIEVRNPATGAAHANVPMLIDTGAEDSFNDTAMLIPQGGTHVGILFRAPAFVRLRRAGRRT
jgi:hypothetical protein